MKQIIVPAKTEKLEEVLAFVNGELERSGCPVKAQIQIDVAVEEIFVNIANYAYHPGCGEAAVCCEAGQRGEDGRLTVTIRFLDSGVPYNPLVREDPDITLGTEDRIPGGLGIYMVKKSMDELEYEYRDGTNILTIKKHLNI